MLIEVAPDKFPCLGPSELRKKMEVLNSLWCGANVIFGKECSIFMEMCPYSGVRNFLGGGGA